MGYYTRHVITIDRDEYRTIENFERLNDILQDGKFLVFNDHLEDSNWNGGSGSKWYGMREEVVYMSKIFGDIPFTIHCEGEERGDRYDVHCCNGNVEIVNANDHVQYEGK